MSMKWVVPGSNAKILAQAVHCLAKLGEDLYVEGHNEKLAFRTVNPSKTSFASFSFTPEFFSFYPDLGKEDNPRCQISMKAALVSFRFTSGMDRMIENCAVVLTPENDRVEFQLKYKQGFVKINRIQLLDGDALQASYENEQLPSTVRVEAKVITHILSSFQNVEITWAISNIGIHFRNFSDLTDDGDGLRCEVLLSRDDLLEIDIAADAELTFCLAELRTILAFAEQISCPLIISYSESGKPIFFIVKNEILTVHIVLATLSLSTSQSTAASTSIAGDYSSQSQASVANVNLCGSQAVSEVSSNGGVHNETFYRLREKLRRVDYDVCLLPGYDEILAPNSDDEFT